MHLKKNIIANYLGQGWRALLGLAFIPLYIKYLGVEAYGLIGIFAILQAWLGLLDMGMKPALGREMARFTGGAVDAQCLGLRGGGVAREGERPGHAADVLVGW